MRLLENYANGSSLESTLAYRDSVYEYSFEREGKSGAIGEYKKGCGRKRREGEDMKSI